jgi:hypothetical protein
MMAPKNKIYISIAIWIALTAAVFGFIAPKLSSGIIALQSSHEKQLTEYNKLTDELQALKKAQEDFNKVEKQDVKPTDLFTSDLKLVNEIKMIEQMAAKTSLTPALTITGTADKAVSVKESVSGLSMVPYSINLKGSFLNVVSFLKYLENSTFISPVNALTVTHDDNGNVNANILTNFYIYK